MEGSRYVKNKCLMGRIKIMTLWELFVAAILGIVEGLTEYAPVSSTGHMIIVDDIWLKSGSLMSEEAANSFKVVIQLGSILAVAIVFKDRILNLLGLKKISRVTKSMVTN